MNKLFIIGLLLISILALSVSAVSLQLNTGSLTVNQKPTKGFSVNFIVTNNGTTNLTGLSVSLSSTELNGFNINFSLNSFNLNAGNSQTVTITGTIPENVNTRLSPSGTVTVSDGVESASLTLNVNAKSQLELDKVKVKVDGDSDSIDDRDTIKDVKPGSKLEFTGDIKNIFTDDEDITIEDVEIEIIIEGIEDGGDDDLEDSEDVGDIDADDKESFSIEFEVSNDVDGKDYDVTIEVTGEDENGAKHFVFWELTLELDKDKHDIWITSASISPSKVSCSRNIGVNVELKNQGEQDEDEVVLRIESSALDIDFEDTSIPELEEGFDDEDTEYQKTYSFVIDDDVKAGTYSVVVKAYYDTDTFSDSETLPLTVEKCVEEIEEEEEEVVVVAPPEEEEEEQPEIITTPITETTEVSLLGSNTYTMLLIGAIAVAVIVIIIMIIVLFSMKKRV